MLLWKFVCGDVRIIVCCCEDVRVYHCEDFLCVIVTVFV